LIGVSNGDICYRCYREFPAKGRGAPCLCLDCTGLDMEGPVGHPMFIRCPSCLNCWNPSDAGVVKISDSGEKNLRCIECNYWFIVKIERITQLVSPAMN
jgi:DNA-directed RNA polymerase subunit RPC12/RpoP